MHTQDYRPHQLNVVIEIAKAVENRNVSVLELQRVNDAFMTFIAGACVMTLFALLVKKYGQAIAK